MSAPADSFTVGQIVEGPDKIYVRRAADSELLAAVRRGEYCYVLAPRQIGKSSLRRNVEAKLKAGGFRVAAVDLSALGGSAQPREKWYRSLAVRIGALLNMKHDVELEWDANPALTSVLRLVQCLELVSKGAATPLVIFLDEIDTVLELEFGGDDLFAAIRSLTQQGDGSIRPTFGLFGVAAPQELMRNPLRTPFNIGRRILLEDFTREEISAFGSAMSLLGGSTEEWLDAVYGWTEGHPYMTQRICKELVARGPTTLRPTEQVNRLVEEYFLREPRQDPALAYAYKRFEEPRSGSSVQGNLSLYRRVYYGDVVEAREGDATQNGLLLGGMVKVRRSDVPNRLFVRNRIYAAVFSDEAIRAYDAHPEIGDAVVRWLKSGRSETFVLRGDSLRSALVWAREQAELVADERQLLDASREVAEREREAHWDADAKRRQGLAAHALALASGLGKETEALVEAIRAAGPLGREGPPLPPTVVEALARACRAASEVARRRRRTAASAPDPGEGDWTGFPLATTLPARRVYAATFSSNGSHVLTAGEDGTARAWDVVSGREVLVLSCADAVHAVGSSPSGAAVVTAGADSKVRVWAFPSGDLLRVLPDHSGRVRLAMFSPSGTRIVTLDEASVLRLWDASDGRLVERIPANEGHIWQVALSRTGDALAVAGAGGASLWETESGRPIATLREHDSDVRHVAFAHRGDLVFTAGADGNVRIWSHDGRAESVLTGHRGPVLSVATSPDGALLVTGGADRTVRLWDVTEARSTAVLASYTGSVWTTQFSPDGRMVLTAGGQRTADLWDVSTHRPILTLRGHVQWIRAGMFSPSGNLALTLAAEGTVRLFHASVDAFLTVAGGFLQGTPEIEQVRSLLTPRSPDEAARTP